MTSVVADTQALIWYILEPEKLSQNALTAFDEVTNAGDLIHLSAISVIEICYLIEKGRLSAVVLERIMANVNAPDAVVVIIPVDLNVGLAVRQIARATVPDMPDRIIAATALYLNLPLVTRDQKIQASAAILTIW